MKAALIRIGNSRGIRIPKVLVEQYRFNDEVELVPRQDHLVIRPATPTRAGWDDAFRQMREQGDDALLDEEFLSATRWDTTEWEW
ncbi:MAG: AbrB/MazE/SpoVT family DNA-binding domain-containing protein [Acidobacteriota bacterium]|nr:AbrB/MazE/SpoVT family DNA-binding domain-containing protein [Acidobacteriota bacterium]